MLQRSVMRHLSRLASVRIGALEAAHDGAMTTLSAPSAALRFAEDEEATLSSDRHVRGLGTPAGDAPADGLALVVCRQARWRPETWSSVILSCKVIRPARTASGVGGQPAMYTSTGMMRSTPCSTW